MQDAADGGKLEGGKGAAGPARDPDALEPVPFGPARLECLELRPLGPLLGIEHLGPEIEEPAAVAVVEPDRELRRVGPGCLS